MWPETKVNKLKLNIGCVKIRYRSIGGLWFSTMDLQTQYQYVWFPGIDSHWWCSHSFLWFHFFTDDFPVISHSNSIFYPFLGRFSWFWPTQRKCDHGHLSWTIHFTPPRNRQQCQHCLLCQGMLRPWQNAGSDPSKTWENLGIFFTTLRSTILHQSYIYIYESTNMYLEV